MITIATIQDFPSIVSLYKHLWAKWDLYDEQRLQKMFDNDIENKRKEYLIAKVENEVVGVCSVRFNEDWHYLKTATIDELIVSNDFRNRGIGRQLLDKACDVAREKSCYRIELHSNIGRTGAHKFYEKYGFEKSSYFFKKKL